MSLCNLKQLYLQQKYVWSFVSQQYCMNSFCRSLFCSLIAIAYIEVHTPFMGHVVVGVTEVDESLMSLCNLNQLYLQQICVWSYVSQQVLYEFFTYIICLITHCYYLYRIKYSFNAHIVFGQQIYVWSSVSQQVLYEFFVEIIFLFNHCYYLYRIRYPFNGHIVVGVVEVYSLVLSLCNMNQLYLQQICVWSSVSEQILFHFFAKIICLFTCCYYLYKIRCPFNGGGRWVIIVTL